MISLFLENMAYKSRNFFQWVRNFAFFFVEKTRFVSWIFANFRQKNGNFLCQNIQAQENETKIHSSHSNKSKKSNFKNFVILWRRFKIYKKKFFPQNRIFWAFFPKRNRSFWPKMIIFAFCHFLLRTWPKKSQFSPTASIGSASIGSVIFGQ